MEERSYLDLVELQSCVKEGLEDLFPSHIWVRAEISSVSVKANGHCYLDLCQSEEGSVCARARAVIWRGTYRALQPRIEALGDDGLVAGMQILARVLVSYSEIYQLSLVIDDIDTAYTVGAAELQRRETIQRLEKEGLMDAQQKLQEPFLPWNLAVVSAPDAAGYGDFCRHLSENEFGFVFNVQLFEAVMQGTASPASVAAALEAVESDGPEVWDAVLIVRGGGSAADLSCFDDYQLCAAIARCPVPVFTAVGHDRDRHIADMVSFRAVKTPTALADEFISALAAEDERLAFFSSRLKAAFIDKISQQELALARLESRILSADPRKLLERGYSLVTNQAGVVLKKASGIQPGQELSILFQDGTIVCEVKYGKF